MDKATVAYNVVYQTQAMMDKYSAIIQQAMLAEENLLELLDETIQGVLDENDGLKVVSVDDSDYMIYVYIGNDETWFIDIESQQNA